MNSGATSYHNPNIKATGVSVVGKASKLLRIIVTNISSSARYLKLYDKATAPTVGTDTPVLTIGLPGSLGMQNIDLSQHVQDEAGLLFTNGIGIGCTTVYTDADATAPTDGDIQVNLLYKKGS